MQIAHHSSSFVDRVSHSATATMRLRNSLRFWVVTLLVSGGWVLLVLGLHATNSRLLPSWHGFLHAGIATQFPSNSFPPENPFFAGEVLPYYWVYQFLGFCISRFLEIDLLHAFQFLALVSLVILVISGGLIARGLGKSITTGVLIGFLALVGVNPLGPVIAGAKNVIRDAPLLNHETDYAPAEETFVSWDLADKLMARPLLGAMYITNNMKHGQNLMWFFDISSRALALAFVMVLLFFFLVPHNIWMTRISLVVFSGVITALSPLMGFGTTGSLLGSSLVLACLSVWRRKEKRNAVLNQGPYVSRSLWCVAGTILAFPSYSHLFLLHDSTLSFTPVSYALLKGLALSANFLVLAPLAVLGVLMARSEETARFWVLVGAGFLLLGAVPMFSVMPGNEHNFTNLAQCILAIPAAVWIGSQVEVFPRRLARVFPFNIFYKESGRLWAMSSKGKKVRIGVICGMFLPVTLCTLVAYSGRPPIPLTFQHQVFQRTPTSGPLQKLYGWIAEATPLNAVFVIDPRHPVKMSGNVSELPAFTSRVLFVDSETYLTSSYQDRTFRENIAVAMTEGQPLTAGQLHYLQDMHRPIYVVTYQADRTDLMKRLHDTYQLPLFHEDFIAVFELSVSPTPMAKQPRLLRQDFH